MKKRHGIKNKKTRFGKSILDSEGYMRKEAGGVAADTSVATEIRNQIGHKALYMLGAYDIFADTNALVFKIRGSKKWKYIKIALNGKDLYDVTFSTWRGDKITNKMIKNVYVDQLHKTIKQETGLYTRLEKGGEMPSYTKSLGLVKVIFDNPKYNYSTNVSGNTTEEQARDYFVGKSFNVAPYPKEEMATPINIEFYPKGTYDENMASGGDIKKWELENSYVQTSSQKQQDEIANKLTELGFKGHHYQKDSFNTHPFIKIGKLIFGNYEHQPQWDGSGAGFITKYEELKPLDIFSVKSMSSGGIFNLFNKKRKESKTPGEALWNSWMPQNKLNFLLDTFINEYSGKYLEKYSRKDFDELPTDIKSELEYEPIRQKKVTDQFERRIGSKSLGGEIQSSLQLGDTYLVGIQYQTREGRGGHKNVEIVIDDLENFMDEDDVINEANQQFLSGKKGYKIVGGDIIKVENKEKGRMISKARARDIATHWHGGQHSALYQFSSSGVYMPENHLKYLREVQTDMEPEYYPNPGVLSKKNERELNSLKKFFEFKGTENGIGTKWAKHPQYGYLVPFITEETKINVKPLHMAMATGGTISDYYIQDRDFFIDKETFMITTREDQKVYQAKSIEDAKKWIGSRYESLKENGGSMATRSEIKSGISAEKISKAEAKKLFDEGKTVYIKTEPNGQVDTSDNAFSLRKDLIRAGAMNIYTGGMTLGEYGFDNILKWLKERTDHPNYEFEFYTLNSNGLWFLEKGKTLASGGSMETGGEVRLPKDLSRKLFATKNRVYTDLRNITQEVSEVDVEKARKINEVAKDVSDNMPDYSSGGTIRKAKVKIPKKPYFMYVTVERELRQTIITNEGIFPKEDIIKEFTVDSRIIMQHGGEIEECDYFRKFVMANGEDGSVEVKWNPLYNKWQFFIDGSLYGEFNTRKDAMNEIKKSGMDKYIKD